MKNWKSISMILLIAVMFVSMFVTLAPATVEADPIVIKVGLPTVLSGPAAPWGQVGMPPYLTWIDLFNKEGFVVNGKTYNFKFYNN